MKLVWQSIRRLLGREPPSSNPNLTTEANPFGVNIIGTFLGWDLEEEFKFSLWEFDSTPTLYLAGLLEE